jgi:hypothetical protein
VSGVTKRARIAIVAVAVVALVIAFIAASGSGDGDSKSTSTTTPAQAEAPATTSAPAATTTTPETTVTTPVEPATPVVRVVGGKPKGGVQRLTFSKGDTVRFKVVSDTADEVHVHGYDVEKPVPAGGSATFSFPAKIDGRFEVELHGSGEQIAQLEVTP